MAETCDRGTGEALRARRQLTRLAARLLGSEVEAEDAVQEGYVRWFALRPGQQDAVASPVAWLNTVVSRVCLDILGSARVRRERPLGASLPEPVLDLSEPSGNWDGTTGDPASRATLDEEVEMAFLVMLGSTTGPQRVTFLLHDVFAYPFPEVARLVGRTPDACRQLATSARRRMQAAVSETVPASPVARTTPGFRQAWEVMDISALVRMAQGATTPNVPERPLDGGAQPTEHPGAVRRRRQEGARNEAA